jgi:hypothetical protein
MKRIALFKKWEPACCVGSLTEKVKLESLLQFIKEIIESTNPQQLFDQYKEAIAKVITLRNSTKHLRNDNISNLFTKYSKLNKDKNTVAA